MDPECETILLPVPALRWTHEQVNSEMCFKEPLRPAWRQNDLKYGRDRKSIYETLDQLVRGTADILFRVS